MSAKTGRSASGTSKRAKYAIQLLPAESDTGHATTKCDPIHLVETMVEEKGSATGTFRIESTGYSGGEERTIVATFRNANFVSYVWYTKYETGDPVIYGESHREPYYCTECGNFYEVRNGRADRTSANNFFFDRRIGQRPDAHRGSRRDMRRTHLRTHRDRSHRIRQRRQKPKAKATPTRGSAVRLQRPNSRARTYRRRNPVDRTAARRRRTGTCRRSQIYLFTERRKSSSKGTR